MGGEASIRFHGELRGLLAPARRAERAVPVAFDVAPSVKDAVEGLGVPHTEVGLLVVDGLAAGFDARLADGAVVEVHSASEARDVPPPWSVRTDPPAPARFLADVHLAALARRLRLLGFDTRLATAHQPDALLADLAAAERRTLLTRDRGLLKRSVVTAGLLVRHDDPAEQVVEVVRRLELADRTSPFTRCLACNGVPVEASPAEVADRVPPRIRRSHHAFRRCPGCDRVYWAGSHHDRLVAQVAEVVARTGTGAAPGR